MKRLQNRVAIITGGAGGQGEAYGRRFASEGACVVLTDIAEDAGAAIVEGIVRDGGQAVFQQHDVTDPDTWDTVVERALSEFSGLHILVNNAGIISRNGIANIPLDAWNRTMAVNLTGAMLGMQRTAPVIRDCGGGSIINICSTAGFTAHYDAAYSASKWGMRGLTKSAAIEFVSWGIRVNSIHPSSISGTSFSEKGLPGHAESARRAIPMERLGTPEECANLALFLASDESEFITGAEIAIDGGSTAGAALWLRSQLRDKLAAEEGD
jgi:3alpha(or 20beta)-hydroxysteroid dehydrogenase